MATFVLGLGHHEIAFAYLLAPIVYLPARRAMLARYISDHHTGHHALNRYRRPLCLPAPQTTARPPDHLKPRSSHPNRGAELDAHFAVYSQDLNPPSRACAQNRWIKSEMAERDRRRAYGSHRRVSVAMPY